jgi:signal transduction histidine kinase
LWFESSEERLKLHVSDTGPGIAPNYMSRLFTPFDRLGAEQSTVEGTGVGLALSKRLAELMKGTLSAQSTLGTGSTFSIELPLAEGQSVDLGQLDESVMPSPTATPLQNMDTVLYIEDNLSNLKLIERILSRRPEINLISAMQGNLGLELAREHHPALILLDLHLPDINGDEVLRRLQADEQMREIPVVMISADATPRQIERLRAEGARDYLTKPLDVKQFLEMLDDQLADGHRVENHR